jgi:cytochrome c oxidase subunit III
MNAATPTETDTQLNEHGPLESFRAPPGAGTLGTWLFTAGLTVAFGWLLFGYAVTRSGSQIPSPSVPSWFWFSTFALLVSSVTLHWSYLSAKMGRVAVAAVALRLATVLGLVFLVLQTPGLVKLIQLQRQAEGANATPYMLVLALVGLHGLHVLAGLGRMVVLNKRNYTEIADAHGAARLKQMCLFWHFLTVAWVVMFGVILWT